MACSKYIRFHGVQAAEQIEKEMGDVLAMIELLKEEFHILDKNLNAHKQHKFTKLRSWSTLFEEEDEEE